MSPAGILAVALLLFLLYLVAKALQPVVNPIMDLLELVVCGMLAGMVAIVVIACGEINDWRHARKVRRGEASDRFPWYYRFKGWRSDLRPDA